jgi:hypothetical protein
MERVAPIVRPGLERELGTVLGQAAFLRHAATARDEAVVPLPPFPAPPRSRRSSALVTAVAACAIAGAVALVAESLNLAALVFGSPARPTLVGHPVGSSQRPVPSTLVGPGAPPGP